MKSLSEFSNVVVISQPMYFPWIGFLSQLSMANTIIWLDDVQFSKGSFINRIQIKNQNKTMKKIIKIFLISSFLSSVNNIKTILLRKKYIIAYFA